MDTTPNLRRRELASAQRRIIASPNGFLCMPYARFKHDPELKIATPGQSQTPRGGGQGSDKFQAQEGGEDAGRLQAVACPCGSMASQHGSIWTKMRRGIERLAWGCAYGNGLSFGEAYRGLDIELAPMPENRSAPPRSPLRRPAGIS